MPQTGKSNNQINQNDAGIVLTDTKNTVVKIDPSELNDSIKTDLELSNQFVMIEDQENIEDLKQNNDQGGSDDSDSVTDDFVDEFIEVKPKHSFMHKVSTTPISKVKKTSNVTFEAKIGQKDYAGGKVNFNKLKDSLLQGGFKNIWKSLFTIFGLFMMLIVVVGACGVGYVLYLYNNIVFDYNQEQSKTSIILASDGKTELFKIYGSEGKRQEASWEEIPDEVKYAFLALEDENYYYNDSGISWYNLGGSILNCATSFGKECRGGSGISQQVVRKLTNDDTRSGGEVVQRKLREIVRAYKLNQNLSKEDIILKYLNIVPLGRNTIGVKEASRSFFGKDVKDLDIVEACYLATFPPSPSKYARAIDNTEKDDQGDYVNINRQVIENRKNICLDKLTKLSIKGPGTSPILPVSELDTLQKKEVKFQADQNIYKYPHFVEYAREELLKIFTNDILKAEGTSEEEIQSRDIAYYKKQGLGEAEAQARVDENQKKEDDARTKAEVLLSNGGFKIVTTINPEMQDKVQKVIHDQAKKNIIDVGANNASAVVVDNQTGELLSMIGSLAYSKEELQGIDGIKSIDNFYEEIDGKVNIATSPQQPGSSFKPYTYATAFEKGLFNPSTVLMDVGTTFDNDGRGYTPQNFTGKFLGPVTILSATANSLNLPAIKGVYLSAGDNQNQQINRVKNNGIINVVNMSRNLGLDFKVKNPEQSCGPQVALGGCEVTMVSHAEAMSTIARMGDRLPVTPFKQICNAQGEDIYNGKMCDGSEKAGIRSIKDEYYKKSEKAIDPKIAYQVVQTMTDVEARTSVFGSTRCILTLNNCNRDKEFKDWEVAAKTGTSNENRDTWTVGFTPDRTAVVWVGRTDNKPTNDASMKSAAPIWQNVMKTAVSGTEKKDFSRPEGMVSVKINTSTGLPVAEGEGGTEIWLREDQKNKLVDSYNKIKDKASKGELDLSKEDIFSLRSTLFSRTVEINKLDQKLVTDQNRNNIAPENIEKKTFVCPVSEFPWARKGDSYNWQEGVNSFQNAVNQRSESSIYGCGPTELSNTFKTDNTPEEKRPILTISGINNGWFYNTYPVSINLTASTNVQGNTITDTQIFVNGEEKSSGKGSSTSYTIAGSPSDISVLNIYFKANDNAGNSATSPVYTITLLPTGADLPPDANKNSTPTPTPSNTPTNTTQNNTPATPVLSNPIKFDGLNSGETLTGNRDLLVISPSQISEPKVLITSTSTKSSSEFTPKELAINGFRYRASFDFTSFVSGEYLIKFTGKDGSGTPVSSDEIKVKIGK